MAGTHRGLVAGAEQAIKNAWNDWNNNAGNKAWGKRINMKAYIKKRVTNSCGDIEQEGINNKIKHA